MVSIQALSAVQFGAKRAQTYRVTPHDKRDLTSGNQGRVAAATNRIVEGGLLTNNSNESDVLRATGIKDTTVLQAIELHLDSLRKKPTSTTPSSNKKQPVHA